MNKFTLTIHIWVLVLLINSALARPRDLNSNMPILAHRKLPSNDHNFASTTHRTLLHDLKYTSEPDYVSESNLDSGANIHPPFNSRHATTQVSTRIAFGQPAPEGMFTFVAYLDGAPGACTGSVIAPRAVLIAAHCIRDNAGWWYSTEQLRIRIGGVISESTEEYRIEVGKGFLKWRFCIVWKAYWL